MPRGRKPVKNIPGKSSSRSRLLHSGLGAVDLHFHGAFGVDLMTARDDELNRLSEELYRKGVSGFCPTTLSAPAADLRATCERLGEWIRSRRAPGAIPLGIHLEGPFLNPQAAGAHPGPVLRALEPDEIEDLWKRSQGTLKILTLAPETLGSEARKFLRAFARKNHIRLAVGHTRCTEKQAREAFDEGFTGVTHAWNALSYHHRDAGVLGAALGNPQIGVELIIDRVHVSDTFIDWTLRLHPENLIFVSDAAPAAGTNGKDWVSFGSLQCRLQDGAARLPDGTLAGGGLLLPAAYFSWLADRARSTGKTATQVFRETLDALTKNPLRALNLPTSTLRSRPVEFHVAGNRFTASPLSRPAKKG